MTNEYKSLPLPELCEILSGGTPKTNIKEYWNGPIPWASVKDFNTGSRWFSKTEKTISQIGLDKCSSVLLEPGDLVISARGTVGVVAQCKVHSAFNQSNYGLRAKNSVSTNDYLYYALCQAKREILSDTHGGMFDTITRETLNRLLIPAPSIKVQEKVAEILGSFDELIEVNNALSKTLEDIAQTIFKSWFIDFDPVKAKMNGEKPIGMDDETAELFPDSFEESELGLIPKGWNAGSLEEIIEIYDSKRVPLSGAERKKSAGIFPYYGATGILDYIDDYIFDGPHILVGEDGTVITELGTPLVQYVWGKFWVSNHAHVLRAKQGFSVEQLKLLIERIQISNYITGAVQPKLNQGNLKSIPCVIPSVEVSTSFGSIIEPFFSNIRRLVDEIKTLSELRDSLLPRLISGELQIPEEMLAS